MFTADMYKWLASMIAVVIQRIFNNKANSCYLSSSLVNFIVKNKLICLYGDNNINNKFVENYPRYFQADPLERFISNFKKGNTKEQI